jgi:hypothetical protein
VSVHYDFPELLPFPVKLSEESLGLFQDELAAVDKGVVAENC